MKRILSLLLILCLVFPVFSLAELDEDDFSAEEVEDVLLDDETDEDEEEGEGSTDADFDFSDLDSDALAALDEDIDAGSIDLKDLEINPNLPDNVINILLIGVDSHIPVEKNESGFFFADERW